MLAQGHATCGSVWLPERRRPREWDAKAGPLASADVCVSVALTRGRGAQAFGMSVQVYSFGRCAQALVSFIARNGICTPAGRRLCSRCSGRWKHCSEFVSHGYEARARFCCAFAGREDPGKAVVRSHHPVRVAVHGSRGAPM